MTTTVASLEARFTANTTGFDAGAKKVKGTMATLGSRMETVGANMTKLGASLAVVAAGPALAFGASIKSAIKFESAFAGVEKTVDATDTELAALQNTIRTMATDANNPLSGLENAHETLAGIMEVGGQLGVPIDKLEQFTQTMGELGISTNMTAEEAAIMTAQFANITGMSFDNVDRFGSTLVDLGNNLATNEKQILEFSQRLAGVGETVGLTEPEILALGGTMASLGLNAEAGSTAITQVFKTMATKVGQQLALFDLGITELSKPMQAFAEVSGVTAKEFADTWKASPVEALNLFLTGLNGLGEYEKLQALEQLELDGIRVSDTLLRMSNNTQLLTDSLNIANPAWEQNTALTAEAEKRAATTEAQWNRMKNTINDLGITIGTILLPAFNSVLDILSPLIGAVGSFAEKHPLLIQVLAGATAALSGLAAALLVLGPLVSAGGTIIGFLSGAPAMFAAVSGAVATLSTVMTGTMVPAILAILGPAAPLIGAAVVIGGVVAALDLLGIGMDDVAKFILSTFMSALNSVISIVGSIVGEVKKALQWLGILDKDKRYQELSPGGKQALLNSGGMTGAAAQFWQNRGFGGNAAGTPWTGSGPTNRAAGFVHNREAVVPAGGMSVIPSPRGLMLQGGGAGGGGAGRTVNMNINGPIYVESADIETLYNQLKRYAEQLA